MNSNDAKPMFVDDDFNEDFGRKSKFCKDLEKKLVKEKKENSIPIVPLVVVGGGLNSLKQIENALESGTPVIIVAVV
jgi:hypothetical protein